MRVIRTALHHRSGWLAWACALALAVRLLVPAGYMPTEVAGMPTIAICDGSGAHLMTMPGMAKHGDPAKTPPGSTCPFAIAAMASLGSVDAFVVAAPIVAAFVLRHEQAQPGPRLRAARLRPPAQGPPIA